MIVIVGLHGEVREGGSDDDDLDARWDTTVGMAPVGFGWPHSTSADCGPAQYPRRRCHHGPEVGLALGGGEPVVVTADYGRARRRS